MKIEILKFILCKDVVQLRLLRRNLIKWSVKSSRIFETGFMILKMNHQVINNDQF